MMDSSAGDFSRHVMVTDFVLADALPQALEGVTRTFPAVVPQVAVMFPVPCPAVMTAPVGNNHVYVAPV